MGSRRTHERAAVAAARAAYIAGFASIVQPRGPAATTAYPRRAPPRTPSPCCTRSGTCPPKSLSSPHFAPRSTRWVVGTTLLVDTYDVTAGVANAVAAAGPALGAVRIDSGELGVLAHQVRAQLDELGATRTRIVVSGDLDEFSIAALGPTPVDSYGVGTSLVTGSGAPTASMVYKLVEVDGIPVQKRSSHKQSRGGRKEALRLARPTGTSPRRSCIRPAARRPSPSRTGC